MTAGRFTSGLSSITFIVSGGAVAQASVFLWLLLGDRFVTLTSFTNREIIYLATRVCAVMKWLPYRIFVSGRSAMIKYMKLC